MSTKRWLLIVLVVVLSVGAVAVFAQEDDDDTFTPFGMMGRGGMMGGFHMMWEGDTPPMFAAVAEALGIDEETLYAELQSGKTISDLAEEYGVELETLSDAWLTTMTEHMNALVEAGVLTQEQVDARLALMSEHFETMPMFTGNHPMFGMMGGMHNGMMGGMHGGMWGHGEQHGPMRRGPNS